MNVSVNDLLLIIGTKEAELFALRARVSELEAQVLAKESESNE